MAGQERICGIRAVTDRKGWRGDPEERPPSRSGYCPVYTVMRILVTGGAGYTVKEVIDTAREVTNREIKRRR